MVRNHIGHRLGAAKGADSMRLVDLLDIESNIKLDERSVELKKLITDQIVSPFQSINNEDELLEHIKMLPYSSMIPGIVKTRYGLSEWKT